MNQVLADTKALTLHAALAFVNLFEEGSPSKGKHHSMRVSCVTTARGDMVSRRCEDLMMIWAKVVRKSVGSEV